MTTTDPCESLANSIRSFPRQNGRRVVFETTVGLHPALFDCMNLLVKEALPPSPVLCAVRRGQIWLEHCFKAEQTVSSEMRSGYPHHGLQSDKL